MASKYIVCPDCQGEGRVLRGGLRGAVFTSEDFADDPDFEENYFNGNLDQTCDTCHGRAVVTRSEAREYRRSQAAAAERRYRIEHQC